MSSWDGLFDYLLVGWGHFLLLLLLLLFGFFLFFGGGVLFGFFLFVFFKKYIMILDMLEKNELTLKWCKKYYRLKNNKRKNIFAQFERIASILFDFLKCCWLLGRL